ncbi:hypothetical protein Zmor_001204 [Zophobas morio]|uniref:RNase H type-1 domain-containing protein n=1 Tax=Zophobas morio TaxID=2755281 RepID=A0AA38MSH1_9CUCU|nr:hypothetical protein Zmor_001204 [Zophobas morio]
MPLADWLARSRTCTILMDTNVGKIKPRLGFCFDFDSVGRKRVQLTAPASGGAGPFFLNGNRRTSASGTGLFIVKMGYTLEQNTFIVMSYYRNGTLNADGEWVYSVQACKDEYLAKFPELNIEEQSLMTHIKRIVDRFNSTGNVSKGKSPLETFPWSNLNGTVVSGTTIESPRTCVYIPRKIKAVLLPQVSSRDVTAVNVKCNIGRGEEQLQGRTTKHTRILTEAFNRIPLLRMGCDRMGTKLIYEKTYRISMSDNSEGRADIDIYVDGAKTDSGSGAGIYSEQLNAQISVPLGTHTSVLQTELMGIMLGARIIAEREIGNKSIRILTDSKSALLALDSCMVRSGLVWECRQTLKYVTQRNSVVLCWIKGHSGNEGNERADEMAKRAARMPFWGPEPAITPSVALSNELVKQYTHRRHEQIWATLSSCRHSRACMATPDPFVDNDLIMNNEVFDEMEEFECFDVQGTSLAPWTAYAHIKIKLPGGEDSEIFRNQEDYIFINVQAICDERIKFQILWHNDQ